MGGATIGGNVIAAVPGWRTGTPGGAPGARPAGGRGAGVRMGGTPLTAVGLGELSSDAWYWGSRRRRSSSEMSSSGCTILLDAPADAIRVGFLMSGGADTTALLVPELVSDGVPGDEVL